MDCRDSFPWWWSSFAGCILHHTTLRTKFSPCHVAGVVLTTTSSVLQLPRHVFKWCAATRCWKTSSPKWSITMLQPTPAANCNVWKRAITAHALSQQTAILPPCHLSPVQLLTPLSCKWELTWATSLQFTSACSPRIKEDAVNFTCVFGDFPYRRENVFLIERWVSIFAGLWNNAKLIPRDRTVSVQTSMTKYRCSFQKK